MKLPRDIAGHDVAKALCRDWGYTQVHQTGSHIILETEIPSHQRITVPDHHSLRVGTLSSILRTVAGHKGMDRQTILDSF